MEALALATDSGLILSPLEISYLRRAVQIAHREAVEQRERDGTLGLRAERLARLDRVLTAFASRDCDVRMTVVEDR